MPYQNEHAARQQAPGKYKGFRRGTPKGFPAGVSAIFGITPDDETEIQCVRFSVKEWDTARAQKWLKANGLRTSIEPATGSAADTTLKFNITKVNQAERIAYGWLYVCRDKLGKQVVDHSEEIISINEIWQAAHKYVLTSRAGGVMHQKDNGEVVKVARLVASLVFTPELKKAMEIPDGILPDGWFVGYYYDDDATWNRVASGELRSFSLGGTAEVHEVVQ